MANVPSESGSKILMYQTDDGNARIEVIFDGDTVWLTQARIAELFGVERSVITKHINNILKEKELPREPTCAKIARVQKEGSRDVKRDVEFYNLDMIISVGYRVNSHRATIFRIWATDILKEYLRKGFAMNDDLLKNAGGGTYFKELLDRIRDIRSSEKVFYRQVLDLFATSIDYDPRSNIAIEFFKEMQNKLHFATHGRTAAELIADRADAEQPFMGLQAFKGNRPQKSEAVIAKNYLTENEVRGLNLMVSAYLDIAEMKANERTPMYMADWVKELEDFIRYRKRPVLTGAGSISHEDAVRIASAEYDMYKKKEKDEMTPVERDFLDTIRRTYELLEKKKAPAKSGK